MPHFDRKIKEAYTALATDATSFIKEVSSMANSTTEAKPPLSRPSAEGFPPDIVRLLDVLARIERRRQARLRALARSEASA